MSRFVFIFIVFTNIWILSATDARAQNVSPYPLCAELVNDSDYKVRGTVNTATATYQDPNDPVLDQTKARHSVNFEIDPNDRYEVCSTGPFYDGQRVELVLRTLIPVFQCYTALIAPISIKSERGADGEFRTWAECY